MSETNCAPAGRRAWRVLAGLVLPVTVLVAVTVWGQFATGTRGGLLTLDLAVAGLSCALLPALLRWPVPAALVLAALAALSPTATPAANVGTLQVAQRRRFAVAAAVAAVGAAAHAARAPWRPYGGLSLAWWLVLVVVAHAGLLGWGALSQARRALIASLQDRARRAEAEQARQVAQARVLERARIAREMHDVLAHRLTLVATYAGALEYRPDAPPEQLARAAGVVREGVHQALTELRDVITLLRDNPEDAADAEDAADPGDPGAPPQPLLADLPRLVAESQAAGTVVRLDSRLADPGTVPPATGRTAYRIVQEALTNARKHAAGQPVEVVLAGAPGERLTIDVCNPLPATAGAPPPGAGTGLVGLTERARLAGGRLDHQVAGAEFRLRAWLPWPG